VAHGGVRRGGNGEQKCCESCDRDESAHESPNALYGSR
jgi:hypothetical protein